MSKQLPNPLNCKLWERTIPQVCQSREATAAGTPEQATTAVAGTPEPRSHSGCRSKELPAEPATPQQLPARAARYAAAAAARRRIP